MTTPTAKPPSPTVASPFDLANQLFDAALLQYKGNHQEASKFVIRFLSEALVYTVSSTTTSEDVRKALLKSVGDTIATAPRPIK